MTTGQRIQARYEIMRPLGSGGFGAVYLARDTRLGRRVALKEMNAARLSDIDQQMAAQLFEREARMLAQLDHPGLTKIWDYFQEDGRVFLVMEYVPGQTLRDLLLRHSYLPEPFVRACAVQLCTVLAYLHDRRPPVIFRDLKPANVMVVAPSGEPQTDMLAEDLSSLAFKLIDFGIARFFNPDQTGDTMVIGTPGYAAPEQYGQGQTDQRSDIYALGATLFALLSGQSPGLILPALSQAAPHVSPEMARIVARATAVEPSLRYQSVAELRRDLLALPEGAPPTGLAPLPPVEAVRLDGITPTASSRSNTTPLPPPGLPSRPADGSPAVLVVLAVLVLGLTALGFVALGALRSSEETAQTPPSATAASRPTTVPTQSEWLLPGATGRIAFGQESSAGPYYDILVSALDGRPPQRITDDGRNFSVAWSPDSRRLAFVRVTRDRVRSAIMVGAPGASATAQIFAGEGYARYPVWSPDGQQLAFAIAPSRDGSFRLAVLDLVSGQVSYPGAERVAWLSWSRQGLLTFAARPAADQAQDIFVLENGQLRNLTNTPQTEEDFPEWSRDGRRLAFVENPFRQLEQRRIAVMSADGSGRQTLTEGPDKQTNPTWSPDGSWIAYLSAPAGESIWQVWAMRPDGTAPRQITFDTGQKFYLAWGE
ncbi:MAG TPA: protein kinase [Roseiflexaceae bacterium]|nr:protein kinase [Roseiflexaceae bacterium]